MQVSTLVFLPDARVAMPPRQQVDASIYLAANRYPSSSTPVPQSVRVRIALSVICFRHAHDTAPAGDSTDDLAEDWMYDDRFGARCGSSACGIPCRRGYRADGGYCAPRTLSKGSYRSNLSTGLPLRCMTRRSAVRRGRNENYIVFQARALFVAGRRQSRRFKLVLPAWSVRVTSWSLPKPLN
jgi:hypothetical protein